MWLYGKCPSFRICVFTSLFDILGVLLFFSFLKRSGGVIGLVCLCRDESVLSLFYRCKLLSGNMVICAIRGVVFKFAPSVV